MDIIEGAFLHRFNRCIHVVVGGYHDYLDLFVIFAQILKDGESVYVGKSYIKDHHIG